MKRLLNVADRYLAICTWKDIALLKTCVVAVGMLIGLAIPARRKHAWAWIASAVFVATYIPLMLKFIPCFKENEEDLYDDDEDMYHLFEEED